MTFYLSYLSKDGGAVYFTNSKTTVTNPIFANNNAQVSFMIVP